MKTTKRGCLLLEWFVEHQLIVINNGEPTFISSAHGTTSAIDLTVVSCSLAAKLRWSIYKDTFGSDHFPIRVTSDQNTPSQRSRKRWIYKDADWISFENVILESLSSHSDIDVEQLRNVIIGAAEKSIPQSSGVSKGRSEIWWTNEVKEKVKARRKALRKLKRLNPSDRLYDDAKKASFPASSGDCKENNRICQT